MINRSNLVVIICMLMGLVVLTALGTWQVNRLYWKEELIERVQQRIASEPTALHSMLEQGLNKDIHEYKTVFVEGVFDHASEVYFFTTGKGGASGWNVHTRLLLNDGSSVIVNRGFVPFDLKDQANRLDGLVEGKQKVEFRMVRSAGEDRPHDLHEPGQRRALHPAEGQDGAVERRLAVRRRPRSWALLMRSWVGGVAGDGGARAASSWTGAGGNRPGPVSRRPNHHLRPLPPKVRLPQTDRESSLLLRDLVGLNLNDSIDWKGAIDWWSSVDYHSEIEQNRP